MPASGRSQPGRAGSGASTPPLTKRSPRGPLKWINIRAVRIELVLLMIFMLLVGTFFTASRVHTAAGGALSTVGSLLRQEHAAFASFSMLRSMLSWAQQKPPQPVLYLWPSHGCGLYGEQVGRQRQVRRGLPFREDKGALLALVDGQHMRKWEEDQDDPEDAPLQFATCFFPALLSNTTLPGGSAPAPSWLNRICELGEAALQKGQHGTFACLYLRAGGESGHHDFYRGHGSLRCEEGGDVTATCRMDEDADWQAEGRDAWDRFPGGLPEVHVLQQQSTSIWMPSNGAPAFKLHAGGQGGELQQQ